MTFSQRVLVVSAAVALMATAAPFAQAQDGRLSLADRVSQLEQQHQQDAGTQSLNVELLNRVNQLQTEVQTLRGMVEEQGHRLTEFERRARDQAMDFDARLSTLEGGVASAPTAPNALSVSNPVVSGSLGGVVGQVATASIPADPVPESTAADSVASPASAVPEFDAAAERAAYDQAFDALKNGQYAEAARRFQSFIDQYPSGEFAPNAQYWLGESYYVTRNYRIALEAFQRLLSSFPDSNKVPDALLKVGYSQYELKHWDEAEATLNRVIQQYPDSTVARLAQGRLRALRLENRQ
ncbi:MAG: tol-pal system protein YbgF [Xanthomonadales bacterium]|nr:tol-pal system protein YbgF [Xanthomonadales bacterium]